MWLLMLLMLVLAGCGQTGSTSSQPHIEGLIYSTHDNNIMVVEGIDSVEIPQEQWQGKPAYSISITSNTIIQDEQGNKLEQSDLSQGDHVAVWHTETVRESYPMQVTAEKVMVRSK